MRGPMLATAAVMLTVSSAAFAQSTVLVDPAPMGSIVLPGEVRTYVMEQQVPSVAYEGDVVVGATLPGRDNPLRQRRPFRFCISDSRRQYAVSFIIANSTLTTPARSTHYLFNPLEGERVTRIIKDIFVVEDDALIAMLLEDMLGDIGYRVSATAGDLDQALAKAESTEFDAAILDVSLAGRSSLPVAKRLDVRGKPYVFATGYDEPPEGSGERTFPILKKPFQLSDLEQALRRLGGA